MANYEKEYKSLNEEQRRAVETTEGPVLVIAGPGTGKTRLLTTRVAYILENTDTSAGSILCLTFTDSAAAVMRERLAKLIGQDAYKVVISTYHSFGSDLIQNYPEYFTEFNTLKHIDELGVETTLRNIMERLPYSNLLKFADVYVKDIKKLISDAKKALLSPDDLRTIAGSNEQFINSASKIVSKELAGFTRVSKSNIGLFTRIQKKVSDIPKVKPPKPGIEPLSEMFIRELDEALSQVAQDETTNPITLWKNAWLHKDDDGRFAVNDIKVCRKLRDAADIYEKYLAELSKHGLYDYDDMIVNAVSALEKYNDLRYSLQERYLYIMLDEFQDTNAAQLRLVELLTDNPVNDRAPNVLAVGDDDQAIYSFQGANYSHMLDFEKKLYKKVETIPLTKNYRSHRDILHLARGVAEQIEQRLHHHFPQIEKTLAAEGKDLPKEAVLQRREAKSDLEQFAWTAKKIRKLIDEGLPASEIAILAPKHKHLEPLISFMHQQNIPVRYEKREDVLDDPAIIQLMRMSELCLALKNRRHNEADAIWPEILSYDFWNIPTKRIWQLSWQAKAEHKTNWTDILLKDKKLMPIALFFIRLSYLAGSERLEVMLDYLVGTSQLDLREAGLSAYKSPYFTYYFGEKAIDVQFGRFWELLSNLTVLRARLRNYKPGSTRGLLLEDFVQFASDHRQAEIKVLNTNPHQEADQSVQIMTSFKAKGQEFSAVFILALSEDFWGSKDKSYSSKISLPLNLKHIRYAGMDMDERLRLLYVAITRAKSQLYLLSYKSFFNGKQTTRLQYLRESGDDDGSVKSSLLPEASQRILDTDGIKGEPVAEFAAYWYQRHSDALAKKDLRELLIDRLKSFQLSPTHINNFINLEHSGPRKVFLNDILKFPETTSLEGEYGDAIHSALLFIHAENHKASKLPTYSRALKHFESKLASKRLGAEETKLLMEKGETCLAAYLKQRSKTVAKANECEYNFRDLGVFIGDAHMGGKIDKIIKNEKNKTLTIVDYKTGRPYSKWESSTKLHRYKQQLYLYKILIENSKKFKDYTISDAYLEFVDPDDNGAIRELHLIFEDKETARIKLLAEAIWNHIQALDFPDAGKYPKTLTGIKQFESDLASKPEQ